MGNYDLVVLGAGPGGYVAAIRAAQLGAKVLVVEKGKVGGICLNWGCIPTKTLIASANALRTITEAKRFGIVLEGKAKPDFKAMMERKNRVVSTLVKGVEALLKNNGVTLIKGRGMLVAGGKVNIALNDGGEELVEAKKTIIATGSTPADLPGISLDGKKIISGEDALSLGELPDRVLIIGAGAIGSEFGMIFSALGSRVIMVEILERPVPMEDAEISGILEREFKKKKIRLYTGTRVVSIEKGAAGLKAELSSGDKLEADIVLVSVGRRFNTENIGLEEVGIDLGKRREIKTNTKLETSTKGIYAIGDVIGGHMLAHVASHEGLMAAENALGGDKEMDYTAVPSGIFTEPEIASVGLTEEEARKKGYKIKVGSFPLRVLGRAQASGELSGLIKLIALEDGGRLIGAHIIGARATELIQELALAINLKASAKKVEETIHTHPTLSEGIMEAAMDIFGRSIHLPPG
jgi:dihydrolipoamide dehydrogenase